MEATINSNSNQPKVQISNTTEASSDMQDQTGQDDQTYCAHVPRKYKGRKSKETLKLLISYYHLYEGTWDEKNFCELLSQTGFTKKQLNKWFWDRKKKETDALEAKRLSYPGLIF